MAHEVQTDPQTADQNSGQVAPIEANTAAINALAEAIMELVSAIKESVLPFDVEFVDCLDGDCEDGERSEAGTRVTAQGEQAPAGANPTETDAEDRVSLPVVPAQSRREPEPGGCGGPAPDGGCCQERAAAGEGRHRKPEPEAVEAAAR